MASSLLLRFSDANSQGAMLADVAVKATLILLCSLTAAAVLQRGSAASRHYIWGVAVVGVLALPFLACLLPQWALPMGWTSPVMESLKPGAVTVVSPPILARSDSSVLPGQQEPSPPASGPPAVGAAAAESPTVEDAAAESSSSESTTTNWGVARWALAGWTLGAIVVLLRPMRGLIAMSLLCRRARPVVESGWATMASEIAQQSRLRRAIRLLTSDRLEIPMIWGIVRPAVLLPETACDWPRPRLRAVLLHEFSHIRRRDLLTRLLARLACAVYWWHPLVWLAARRLYLEGEKAADDSVLRSGVRPSEYASHLFEIARGLRTRAALLSPVAAVARRSELRGRVVAILGTHSRRPVTPLCAGFILALAAMLLVPLAAARPSISAEAVPLFPRPGASQGPIGQGRAQPLDLYGDPIPASATACLGTFRLRHSYGQNSLAFSPDGKKLVSMAASSIRVWETATGRLLWDIDRDDLFPGDTREAIASLSRNLHGFCASNDGSIAGLVGRFQWKTRDTRYSIILVRATAGKPGDPLELKDPDTGESSRLCFTPDGTRLVVGHAGGVIHLWDVDRQKPVLRRQVPGTRGGMAALEVSPDGKLLVAVFGNKVFAWPWESGKEPSQLRLEGFDGRAVRMAFSADGKRLAIGHGDPTGIRVWDLQTGRLLETLTGPSVGIYTGGFAFTPGGVRLATTGITEKKVFLWDMSAGKQIRQFKTDPFEPNQVVVSHDGQWIAAGCKFEARIRVWNTTTGDEVAKDAIGHDGTVNGLQFSADGKIIVTAGRDGTVRTWDVKRSLQRRMLRHDRSVGGVAISPQGEWIASNSHDDSVRLWDAATGKEVRRWPGHGRFGALRPITFSNDGRRLCTWANGDLKLRVWDVATAKSVHEWEVPPADVRDAQMARFGGQQPRDRPPRLFASSNGNGARFSPDGTLLVLAMIRGTYLFEVETGKQVHMIAAKMILQSSAVAPDGKRLVVVDDGFPARPALISLYELSSGREIWSQQCEAERASLVTFSTDGGLIAVANDVSRQIRILDGATGNLLHTIGPVPRPSALQFSPDGKALSCGTADGAVLLWDLPRLRR